MHSWGDQECVTILKNAAAALNKGGRIIIMDVVSRWSPSWTRNDVVNFIDSVLGGSFCARSGNTSITGASSLSTST
jgi:hypothetical protein